MALKWIFYEGIWTFLSKVTAKKLKKRPKNRDGVSIFAKKAKSLPKNIIFIYALYFPYCYNLNLVPKN